MMLGGRRRGDLARTRKDRAIRTPDPWQRDVLEDERRVADLEATDRDLAIGEWAFAVDIPERGA